MKAQGKGMRLPRHGSIHCHFGNQLDRLHQKESPIMSERLFDFGKSRIAVSFLLASRLLFSSLSAQSVKPADNIDDLIMYTRAPAAWSDRGSSVALNWNKPDSSGIQELLSICGWWGNSITERLLSWKIIENEKPLALTFVKRIYRPDKIVELDSLDGLKLEVTVSCPVRNGLVVEFDLANKTNNPKTVACAFTSPATDSLLTWEGPFPVGKIVSLENEKPGCWSTIYPHHAHGLTVKWVENYVTGMTEGDPVQLVCLTDLSPQKVTLEPNGKYNFKIPLGFGKYRGQARDTYQQCVDRIRSSWNSVDEAKRWSDIFGAAPNLPEKYKGKEKYERLYKQAIAGLNSLFIQGEGGYTGNKRILYTTKHGLAIAFFWDSGISCVGAREFNAAACQEALECLIDNVGPRGSLPGTMCDTHRAGEGQAPVMSWAVWSVYQRSKDKDWLARVYPTLCGYVKFWFKYHSSERGLCKYFNAGQIGDNDARFDPIIPKGQGNLPVYGFESPDVNAFLVTEMKCLSQLAKELNLTDDARGWDAKATQLGQKIVDTMYFPDEAMFYDVKEGTKDKFSGVKSPNMFLPLRAGVPLPEKEIRRIIENHMLNPNEFYRRFPFPSLSYDNPEYDPEGYWRGRIWPHIVYWMIQTLWKHGYHKQAVEVADNLLNMFLASPWIAENYESKGGTMIGEPEYNWSQSMVIELLLERYKDPLP
jgi:hypothetical protein